MEKTTEEILTRVMYRLYHLDVHNDIYDEKNYPDKTPLNPLDIKWENHVKTYLALKWAVEHPDFDYKQFEKVKYSLDEINYFFKKEFEWYQSFLKKNNKI